MLILLGTFVLPQLAPLPVKALGLESARLHFYLARLELAELFGLKAQSRQPQF